MSTEIPAGWYPDHTGEPQDRWWDGDAWTDRTRVAEAASTAPTDPPSDPPTDPPSATADPTSATADPASTPADGAAASAEDWSTAWDTGLGSTPPAAAGGVSWDPGPTTPPPSAPFTAAPMPPSKRGAGVWIAVAVASMGLAAVTGVVGFLIGQATAEPEILIGEPEVAEEFPFPDGGDDGGFLGDGETTDGDRVTRGQTVSGAVPENGEIRFPLTLDDGGQTVITASAAGGSEVDPYLTLLGPDGETLEENDDFNGCCDSRIDIDLEPGEYTLVVRSFGGFTAGQVDVQVE